MPNTKNKSIEIKISILILNLFILSTIFLFGCDSTKMTFTSLEHDSTYVYAYISAEDSTDFNEKDFAIKINNDLISASRVDRYSTYNSKITFKVSYSSIDKPTTIYYKGKKMEVGDTIKY